MVKKKKETEEKKILYTVASVFVPGLGQLLKGDTKKAAMFFVGYMMSIFLLILLIGFILVPLVWAYNVYDAYTAKALK